MKSNNLDESIVASLLQDIADFCSVISYNIAIGPKDGTEEDVADNIRARAGEITDSINNIFGNTIDRSVKNSSAAACELIWEATGLAISSIDAFESDDDDDDDDEDDDGDIS
jgi:hypothetical protein